MTPLSAMARPACVAAMCIVALPLVGKNVGTSAGSALEQKTQQGAGKAAKVLQRNSVAVAKSSKAESSPQAKAPLPKPNFYAETSGIAKKSAARSGSSSNRAEKSTKTARQAASSTVAGPSSVRRLQPSTREPVQAVSYSPVEQTQRPAATATIGRSGITIPKLSAQVSVDANPKKSPWARLNPLSLFESRKPKLVSTGYIQTGIASWYGSDFHGGSTASGERYDMYDLTAAHPSLPFGTLLRVTNLRNGKEVVVRVNNRGPYVRNRILDLSKEAARQLGMVGSGLAKVRVEVLEAVEPVGHWGQQALRKLAGQ